MRPSTAIAAVLAPGLASCVRIIQSNDDGWAELYLRAFHDALLASGHDAVVSAPAENKSGTSTFFFFALFRDIPAPLVVTAN
jgi:hypothetical protein